MKLEEKFKILHNFSETQLVNSVIVSLFKSMGFKDISITHGINEHGLDLIFYKETEFGEREYTGVQVKAVKIHGTAGKTGNATEILVQANQAFSHSFHDIYDNSTRKIDRFIVITSHDIDNTARDSIKDQLLSMKVHKTIHFFDGAKLIDLIDKHMKSFFWDEYDYIHRYFNAMKKDFETIKDISAIGQKDPIPLEQMYVSLKVSEKTREREIPLEKGRKIFDEEVIQKKKEVEKPTERVNVIDVDKALKDYKKFVIVGAPGSGKTTVLKHLALKSCKENLEKQERICTPVPIILLKFLESGKDLRDYIDVVFEKYDFPMAKEFVEKDLKEGKCMVFLDGFDELVSKENQEQVTVQIQEFVKRYHRCQIIVTSRVAGYHDELKDFMKLELMEFDDKQIRTFIKNWFGKTEPDKAKSMQEAIENEHIKDIVRNPLMITITAIIHEEDKRLPQKRAELYKRCVEVLLNKWDVQRRLRNKYASDKKEFILRKLAFYGHSKNKRIMTEGEITEEMLKHFPRLNLKEQDAKPFLNEIWQRSYLLRQISMDSYDFLHLSFQEYFTALELKEQSDGLDFISKHLSEPWWEEPTLLYAGIKNDATDLIKKIRKELPEDIFYSNLILFGKCIIDAEHTEPSLKEEVVNNLWSLYRNAEFSSLRERAIKILARIKPENYIDLLVEELGDKNKESGVRRRAAEALGRIGGEKAVESLIIALAKDKDDVVRWRATEALGMIGGGKAVEPLITDLTTNKDDDVRRRAAEALGIIGGEKAVEPLITTLAKDKANVVRGSAALALGMIGGEKAVEPLIIALAKDKADFVRERATEALGMVGGGKAVDPLITTLTKDKADVVRGGAAFALGMIGGEKAVEPLIIALAKDKDDVVRWRAAKALVMIGGGKAVEPLITDLTTDKNDDVRRRAAEALGRIGGEKAVEPLIIALTTDKDDDVRRRAAEALGRIGGEKAVEPLITALAKDKADVVRGSAAEVLGMIGGGKAVEPLITTLAKDKADVVRGSAAFALGMIGGGKAVEPLITTLAKDKAYVVRGSAVFVLGMIGGEKAVESLITALAKDKADVVRGSAAEVLGRIGGEKAVEPLKLALKDKGVSLFKPANEEAFYALEKICRRIGKRIPLETSKAK